MAVFWSQKKTSGQYITLIGEEDAGKEFVLINRSMSFSLAPSKAYKTSDVL